MEQLPLLRLWRAWVGSDQRLEVVGGEDSEEDGEGVTEVVGKSPTLRLRSGQAFSRQKRARNGAPGLDSCCRSARSLSHLAADPEWLTNPHVSQRARDMGHPAFRRENLGSIGPWYPPLQRTCSKNKERKGGAPSAAKALLFCGGSKILKRRVR